ncbi:MAG TPA: ATP-binding protein [Rhodospirillaceae bacterium]|nr:ATP-binding protein [Rhodospirillaceae bacterium]
MCRLRHEVGAAAGAAGCPPEMAEEVVLAVDEACQNIIRHAYRGDGEIVLEIRLAAERRLEILLIDFAAPVDPGRIVPRPLDELRPGGLGTHFIRSVMEEVSYLPPPPGAGNFLRMTRTIR